MDTHPYEQLVWFQIQNWSGCNLQNSHIRKLHDKNCQLSAQSRDQLHDQNSKSSPFTDQNSPGSVCARPSCKLTWAQKDFLQNSHHPETAAAPQTKPFWVHL